MAGAEPASGSRGGSGSGSSAYPGSVARDHADGTLGMGSLGERDPESRHAPATGRGDDLQDGRRKTATVLFRPFFVHRSRSVKERPASRSVSDHVQGSALLAVDGSASGLSVSRDGPSEHASGCRRGSHQHRDRQLARRCRSGCGCHRVEYAAIQPRPEPSPSPLAAPALSPVPAPPSDPGLPSPEARPLG